MSNLDDYYVKYGRSKPKTNADRIRAMTDEQLAELIGDDPMFNICPHDCFKDPNRPCAVCALKWLKQEVSNDS